MSSLSFPHEDFSSPRADDTAAASYSTEEHAVSVQASIDVGDYSVDCILCFGIILGGFEYHVG